MLKEILLQHQHVSDFTGRLTGLTYVSGNSPSGGQWAFNSNKELHVVDNSNSAFGAFSRDIYGLSIGDILEIECEIISISGTLPKIGIDLYGTPNVLGIDTTNGYNYPQNQWQRLRLEYLVYKSANYHRVNVGTFTTDIGEYKLRNLTIKIKTQNNINLFDVKTFEYSSSTYTDVSTTYKSTIRKDNNGMVNLIVNAKRSDDAEMVADGAFLLGTLPVGYRPIQNIRFNIMGESANPVARWGNCWIDTAGGVMVRAGTALKDLGFVISFPTQ